MKATVDFDPVLYQRLKVEAARRGRTVKDLVADGVRHVLATPIPAPPPASEDPPPWVGSLRRYAKNAAGTHDLGAIRDSITRGRKPRRAR